MLEIIPIWLAVTMTLLGVTGLIFRNKLSNMVAQVGSPLGLKVKTTLMILAIIGIVAGGGSAIVGYATGVMGTASILPQAQQATDMSNLDCRIATVAGMTASTTGNSTDASYSADTVDETHYTAYLRNVTAMGSGTITANLSCERDGNFDKEEAFECWIEGDSFKSDVSTSDMNSYFIIATSNQQSYVEGFPYRQTAYINDNAQATSSTSQERKMIVFSDGDAEQTISTLITLPGDTALNYLKSDTEGGATPSFRVKCNGEQVGYVTIVKKLWS